jgi:hypothetical protein
MTRIEVTEIEIYVQTTPEHFPSLYTASLKFIDRRQQVLGTSTIRYTYRVLRLPCLGPLIPFMIRYQKGDEDHKTRRTERDTQTDQDLQYFK